MDKPSNLRLDFDPYCDDCNLFRPDLDRHYISDDFIDIECTTITCEHIDACDRMYTLFAPTGKETK